MTVLKRTMKPPLPLPPVVKTMWNSPVAGCVQPAMPRTPATCSDAPSTSVTGVAPYVRVSVQLPLAASHAYLVSVTLPA